MKKCVVTFNRVSENSTLAHNKIANFFHDYFGFEIIDRKELCSKLVDEYDIGILINGLPIFCDFAPRLFDFFEKRVKIKVYAQNDYNIKFDKNFRTIFKNGILLTTLKDCDSIDFDGKVAYANFNSLSANYGFLKNEEFLSVSRPRSFIYYGAFRKHRKKVFDKYFIDSRFPIYLSATSRAAVKFKEYYKDLIYVEPLRVKNNFILDLLTYNFSIYMEDTNNYNKDFSFPNRFYECLSAGVVLFIDKNSEAMFRRNNISNFADYIVDGKDELRAKIESCLENRVSHVEIQRHWVEPEKELNELKRVVIDTLSIPEVRATKKGLFCESFGAI